MKLYHTALLFVLAFYSCKSSKSSEDDVEAKAIKLIKDIDTNTLSFLKSWNYTNRMNYYNTWTKVKDYDSLEYSFLYEPLGDTTYIEIYEVSNFLKDYTTTFNFDTTGTRFYGLEKVGNNIISIYPDGKVGNPENLISKPIPLDSMFTGNNPFNDLEKINHYKDKFNFSYCNYTPIKGNYIQFTYFSNGNEDILYYIPNDLVINDKNLYSWFDKFSKGKRLSPNWILIKKDSLK